MMWFVSCAGIFLMGIISSVGVFSLDDLSMSAVICGFFLVSTLVTGYLGVYMAQQNFFAAVTQTIILIIVAAVTVLNALVMVSMMMNFDNSSGLPFMGALSVIGMIPMALTLTGSTLLVIDAYRERVDYDDEDYFGDYDDEDDDYEDSDEINPYDVSPAPAQPPRVRFEPPPRAHAGGAPDVNRYGEFLDDGYEWIEWPEESDSWLWRDPNTGEWVDYRG